MNETPGQMALTITAEPLRSPDAQQLLRALDEYLNLLYPPASNFVDMGAGDVVEGRGIFLVARENGVAIACGALRRIDATTAEVKRMFVAPPARGRGVARAILVDLEEWATAAGVSRLVLETGHRQVAATRFYERSGFTAIPCFGEYANTLHSACYEKRIRPRRSPVTSEQALPR